MIDSERLYREAQNELLAEYKKPPPSPATLRKIIGRKPLDSIGILIRDLDLPADPVDLLRRRDELMFEKLRTDLRAMPGLFEILENLKGRLPLAVATGSDVRFLELVLNRLELRNTFAVLRSSADVKQGKPDPEIYHATAAALNVPPSACVVLEDSENGVVAAHAAGCTVAAIPSEYTRDQDFSQADAQFSNLLEAAGYIDSLLLEGADGGNVIIEEGRGATQ